MKFNEMLIMVGPAGVPCEHSIIDPKSGRALNNHWLKSSKGVVVARGCDYTGDYEVVDQGLYEEGHLIPRLMTISDGSICQLDVTEEMITDNWELIEHSEVSDLLNV